MILRHRTSKQEQLFRKILFLPAQRPDPLGLYTEVPDDNPEAPYVVLKWETKDKIKEQKALWHDEGQRADLAEKCALLCSPDYWGRKIKNKFEHIEEEISTRKASKELSEARHLQFLTDYQYAKSDSLMTGHLKLPSGRAISIRIIAAGYVPQWVKQENELFPEDPITDENNIFYGKWIMIPGNSLNEKKIKAALQSWYRERFRWQRGHWSNIETTIPEIDVVIKWDELQQD